MSAIRLGRTPAGRDILFDPFAAQHTVLTGRTRSGKSVQVYGMLAQLRDLPVQLAGIDPTGILFNAVGNGLGGPDLRVLTLRDPDRAGAVIDEIVAVMDKRIQQLLAEQRDKFTEFSSEFPLIVAVFEEYPGLLAALAAIDKQSGAKVSDRVETKIRAAIQRLALEGAKVGIRLWLIAQRADANLLTGVLRSQLTQKISFAQDADGLRMLHEGITPEQIEQAANFLPGQGYVELSGSEPLTMFRADLMTYEQLAAHFRR